MKLGVIGVGNMGQALLRGAIGSGVLAAAEVVVYDPRADIVAALGREIGVQVAADNAALVAGADAVLICVKPQVLRAVMAPLGAGFGPDTLAISIAAGITLTQLQDLFAPGTPVVRVMPNTPCMVGAGASGWCRGPHATDAHGAFTRELLEAVGVAVEIDESQMNALIGVSGSGPAYVFRFIEGLVAGGVRCGLSAELATALAIQTVAGAAALAAASDVDPAELRRRVTSPGGTTQAALASLKSGGFHDLLEAAVVAARDRGDAMERGES